MYFYGFCKEKAEKEVARLDWKCYNGGYSRYIMGT